jgi:hypothetical protein
MTRVRDHVQFGSPQQVSTNLQRQAELLDKDADRIWPLRELGPICHVLSNLLRCTARQLRMLDKSAMLPIEVAAGACRTTFEVNIRTRLVISNPARLHEFIAERVFDEISILEAFKSLVEESPEETPKSVLDPIDDRLRELLNFADKKKLSKPKRQTWEARAREANVSKEYNTLWRLYSNYVHGSSWLVNAQDSERDNDDYRNLLLIQTQIYAGDTKQRIDTFLESRTERTE